MCPDFHSDSPFFVPFMSSHRNNFKGDEKMTNPQLLTTEQAAELLAIRPETLCRWRLRGAGPAYVQEGSRYIRYRRDAIETFLAEREVAR